MRIIIVVIVLLLITYLIIDAIRIPPPPLPEYPLHFIVEETEYNWIIKISDADLHFEYAFSLENLTVHAVNANGSVRFEISPLISMQAENPINGIAFLDISPFGILNKNDLFILDKAIYGKGSKIRIIYHLGLYDEKYLCDLEI
ncbi:MAG: hypothetical protein QXN93_05545 [Methanomassiliicoccales archaeon]